MPVHAAVTSFNAGELSPKMLSRVDVSQYGKGCRTLKNFIVTPYGAVEKRPGTEFIALAKYADKNVRLIRFVFSRDVAYIAEFGEYYIRFYKDKTFIQEIAAPYAEADLKDLKTVQSADVMTIVHPFHPVMELKRLAENSFTLAEKEFQYPPVLEPNIDDDFTLTPSARTGSITMTASKDCFTSENIGGFYQLIHTRKSNEISKDFTANGTSDPIEVYGYWTFTTHGTWTGNVKIQRSFDDGKTWNDFRTYSSAKDSNTSTSGEEEGENVLYRISMSDYEQSDTGTLKMCRCLFVNPDFQTTGVVRIDSVTDAKTAAGTVIRKLGEAEATVEWNEGAWSKRRGFPRTIAYFEERMVFGGTAYRPQTVWASKTNDWDNFLIGSKDDDGLEFTMSSDTVNTICWMCQHDALVIGTIDSEWTLSASNSEAALTPSNFKVRRQSVYGSAGIPAQMVGDTILFVQQGNRKVREFVFQWEKNGYVSPDMTILADHITESGIKETALQQLPDSILWCVLNNGTLAALTYERDQEVVGWHRHDTQGEFISVCTLPAENENLVCFAVRRNGKVCIEIMSSRNSADLQSCFFADSGIRSVGTDLTEVSGLDHLEGLDVSVMTDGAFMGNVTVKNGRVALGYEADNVVVGLPYVSEVSPMPIEIEMQNGSSMLRNKSVGTIRARVYNSVGGEIRCGSDRWQQILSRDVLADDMDKAITPKSEVVTLNMISGSEESIGIFVRHDLPLPFNLSCLVASYKVES